MAEQKYRIVVDDNFHFMDESESYISGSFSTYEEAIVKCKAIIDGFLEDAVQPEDTAESLYSTLVMFGETPHIHGESLGNFSAVEYARQRCRELTNRSLIQSGPFLIKPMSGETLAQFQLRLTKLISSNHKKSG